MRSWPAKPGGRRGRAAARGGPVWSPAGCAHPVASPHDDAGRRGLVRRHQVVMPGGQGLYPALDDVTPRPVRRRPGSRRRRPRTPPGEMPVTLTRQTRSAAKSPRRPGVTPAFWSTPGQLRMSWVELGAGLARTGAPDRLAGGDQAGQVLAFPDPASRGQGTAMSTERMGPAVRYSPFSDSASIALRRKWDRRIRAMRAGAPGIRRITTTITSACWSTAVLYAPGQRQFPRQRLPGQTQRIHGSRRGAAAPPR